MSEAAQDQGWLPPEHLQALRAELNAKEVPVDDETGIEQVRETRRRLEESRKAKKANDDG